jgi:type I restriction enzyme S subunit
MWLNYRGIGVSKGVEGYVSPAYRVYHLDTEIVDPRFIHHLMRSDLYVGIYTKHLKGIRPNSLQVSTYDFQHIKMVLPPLQEQKLISRYLDKKTEQIDDLIEKIQKKIEFLKEQRTSLINQCVTKGLDPNVEMKDSGVEWIGEIPKHWEISKVKWVTEKIGSGVTPRGGSEVYSDSGIFFLRSQNIHFDGLHLDDVVFISEEIDQSMPGSRVKKDDVLYNITGGSIGRCCLIDSDVPMNVNQHVCIVRPSDKIVPEYLLAFLSSHTGQTQLEMNLTGSGREGLNFENLGNFQIPRADWEEQKAIGSKISKISQEFFILSEKLTKHKKLLSEYRQSLISSVVTGKVRVTEDMM